MMTSEKRMGRGKANNQSGEMLLRLPHALREDPRPHVSLIDKETPFLSKSAPTYELADVVNVNVTNSLWRRRPAALLTPKCHAPTDAYFFPRTVSNILFEKTCTLNNRAWENPMTHLDRSEDSDHHYFKHMTKSILLPLRRLASPTAICFCRHDGAYRIQYREKS